MTAPAGRARPVGLWVHAAVVTLLVAVFALAAVQPTIGANIGAGIALLPVLASGIPWTLPMIVDPYAFDRVPEALWYLAAVGPAVLNVALHAALVRWRDRAR